MCGEVPLQTIEEIADWHLTKVAEVQSHGPYRIAGWSVGRYNCIRNGPANIETR